MVIRGEAIVWEKRRTGHNGGRKWGNASTKGGRAKYAIAHESAGRWAKWVL
jgi:hypothetical protein